MLDEGGSGAEGGPRSGSAGSRRGSFPSLPEERLLFARILRRVLRVTLAAMLAATISTWLLITLPGSIVHQSLLLAMLPLLLAAFLARRGWSRVAALLVPLDMLALATVLVWTNDGLQDIAILVYPGVLAAAGLLLDKRSYLVLSGLALVSLAAVAWGQSRGLVRLVDPSHRGWIYGDLLVATVLLVAVALMVALMVDVMREALATSFERARELRESEAAARRERTISDALIDHLPGAFYLIDTEGRYVRWNRAYVSDLGYDDAQMAGRSVLDVVAPQDREAVNRGMQECLRDGAASLEAHALTRDGRPVPYFLSAVRVELEGRTYLLGTGLDLSERRRLQEQLYRAQKMEAIGSLAGGIAHDFNNLLFAMGAFAELAQRRVADRPAVAEHLDKLMQSLARARDLVAKIRIFSRRETAVTETIDLRPLAEEVYRLLRASCPPAVRVKLSQADAPVLVRANTSEIHQVLLNLGTNAAHAMGEAGGTLEISVGWSEPRAGGSARRARLSVRDEGCGIPASVRHRIFDPYFTTKRADEGTGLGLAIVHGIVTAAGGSIEVDSAEGRGTRFDVLLPIAGGAPAAAPEPSAPAAPPAGRGERLALVDDEPLVAMALAEALSDLGYDVELYVDSRAARRALTSAPGVYDLVICDESLTHLGGRELVRTVRDCVPGLRVLLLGSRLAPAGAPADPSLPRLAKPVPLQLLAREIRRLLDGEPPVGPTVVDAGS